MTVEQLIEKLKELPKDKIVVVDGFESYGYDTISIIEEIDVHPEKDRAIYGTDFAEYANENKPIKAIRLR